MGDSVFSILDEGSLRGADALSVVAPQSATEDRISPRSIRNHVFVEGGCSMLTPMSADNQFVEPAFTPSGA